MSRKLDIILVLVQALLLPHLLLLLQASLFNSTQVCCSGVQLLCYICMLTLLPAAS
jgi:hypothetical protein